MLPVLLSLLACGPKAPPEPPVPLDDQGRPYPPARECSLGPDERWSPDLATLCRVPWEGAQPWPEEGVRVELDDPRGRGGHVRILMEEWGAEMGAQFDVPYAVLPDGTGVVAGNLRILDGPEGEVTCPGPAPTHALRLRSFGAWIEIGIPLSGACAADPPVYEGLNAVMWERPLPGGGSVDVGPAQAWFRDATRERPEELPAGCVDRDFDLGDLRRGAGAGTDGRCPLDYGSARPFPGPDQLAFEAGSLVGRSPDTVDFDVVYRNITDAPLTIDLQLSAHRPVWASALLRDGQPVEAPDHCVVGGFLEQGEAHRITLLPGGTLTVPVRAALVPSGFALMPREPGCDRDLDTGFYRLRVPAPGPGGRTDEVPIQLVR